MTSSRWPCRVHGQIVVQDPALLAVLDSAAMRRLAGVLQYGPPALLGLAPPVTRLEHSLGVMALVRALGGGLEAQLPALLHDASHGAFSHVLDQVFPTQGGSPHDLDALSILTQTDLPELLATLGFDLASLLDKQRHPIVAQPRGALAADRVDGIVRDAVANGIATPGEARRVLSTLRLQGATMTGAEPSSAALLVTWLHTLNARLYVHPSTLGVYFASAQMVRRALELGVCSRAGLFAATDAALLSTLTTHADPILRRWSALLDPQRLDLFALDAEGEEVLGAVEVRWRWIDPLVLHEGREVQLSTLDAATRSILDEARAQSRSATLTLRRSPSS